MVVIVILGVLAALVVPKVMSRPDEARVVAAKQDISAIMQALKLYKLDNRRYPHRRTGSCRPCRQAHRRAGAGQLEVLPRQAADGPVGQALPVRHARPQERGGRDELRRRRPLGREGFDADIGSWSL
jgi:general secretion pathway protein G